MTYSKEELKSKINNINEKIIYLQNNHKITTKEIKNINKERFKNHIIIFLSFVISIITTNLIDTYSIGLLYQNKLMFLNLLKFLVITIPYVSFFSYEIKTKEQKKYLNNLKDKMHLLNREIFNEEFFLKIYNDKLKQLDTKEIFSKHQNLGSLDIDYDYNKTNDFVKKIK